MITKMSYLKRLKMKNKKNRLLIVFFINFQNAIFKILNSINSGEEND